MCFYNKFRLFLSVIGLCVGLFVFTTGNILIDSYYNEVTKDSMQMAKNTVALKYESPEHIDKNKICTEASLPTIEVISAAEKTMIFAKKYQNKSLCTLTATMVGVSETKNIIPIKSTDENFLITKTSLIKGRAISNADVANKNNVVIIDELTEKLLFPDGNSLGSQIKLNVSIPGVSNISTKEQEQVDIKQCTIIGVIKNSYYQTLENMKYNKFISNPLEQTNLNTVIYFPLSYVSDSFELTSQKILAWSDLSDYKIHKLKNKLTLYKNHSLKPFFSYDIIDRETIIADTHKELEPLKLFLVVIMVILLLISGINAMSTMFFSVKERINEIGIKKALGASKIEILNQFIIEGILVALISSVITIFFSCLTVLLVENYLNNNLFILFGANFTADNLLLPISVAILYGFIFSLIPSYYGARIKVTDSLRFE